MKWLDDEVDNNDELVVGEDGGDAMECLVDSDVVECRHFFQMIQQMVWNIDIDIKDELINPM